MDTLKPFSLPVLVVLSVVNFAYILFPVDVFAVSVVPQVEQQIEVAIVGALSESPAI